MTDRPEPNPSPRSVSVRISAALLAVACCAAPVRAAQPQAASPPARAAGPSAPPSRPESAVQRSPASQEIDAGSRNVAARARMLECGHQWSNMKRAGTAAGGTWKDFSRGCLGQR